VISSPVSDSTTIAIVDAFAGADVQSSRHFGTELRVKSNFPSTDTLTVSPLLKVVGMNRSASDPLNWKSQPLQYFLRLRHPSQRFRNGSPLSGTFQDRSKRRRPSSSWMNLMRPEAQSQDQLRSAAIFRLGLNRAVGDLPRDALRWSNKHGILRSTELDATKADDIRVCP